LITGGTGVLGSLFARHLAAVHGVRRLLLARRRGPEAPRGRGLVAPLAEKGAGVGRASWRGEGGEGRGGGEGKRRWRSCVCAVGPCVVFFFKQEAAYEIGQ